MNNVPREYLDNFVMVYLDDIPIFSRILDEHRKYVYLVLQKLV